MNGNCDICKEPLMSWHLSPDNTFLFGSVYCNECMEKEKPCIEARQRLYRKMIILAKQQEYDRKYKNYKDEDRDRLTSVQLDWTKKHRFDKPWLVREKEGVSER